ncbi:MAG: hypothetical protein AB1424_01155 [Thermodesulfobacteriota bacterium]
MTDEVAVLLPEVEIGGHEIKPWSFGKFKKVFPAVAGQLVPALKEAGLTLENFEEGLASRGAEIIGAAFPAFTPLIAASLDLPEAQVDEMDFDQAVTIGLTIISQNLGRIKNSLPLIMEQFRTVTRGN